MINSIAIESLISSVFGLNAVPKIVIFFEARLPICCLVIEIICYNCILFTSSTAFKSYGLIPDMFAKLINAFISFGKHDPP